jgi:hypothetical protein
MRRLENQNFLYLQIKETFETKGLPKKLTEKVGEEIKS